MQEVEQFEEPLEEPLDLGARHIWAIGGGKGGVGKSFVSANLAVGLAQRGNHVVVVDADLGGANMHTCLGIDHPPHTLADFIDNRVGTLEEIMLTTEVPRLKLISGASDILSLANPQYSQKQKLLRHLKRLRADYILLDLGAGTTYNVLDFFNLAHTRLVVVTPEPTSIQNGYGFIKSALFRALQRQFSQVALINDMLKGSGKFADENAPRTVRQMSDYLLKESPELGRQFQTVVQEYKLKLILNMTTADQTETTWRTVRTVSRGFLSVDLELVGAVERDEKVQRSVEISRPVLLSAPESESARRIRGILDKLTRP
ncbi:MAG: P-loop NTPase [Myxococcota bacterium]